MTTKTVLLNDFAKELGEFSDRHIEEIKQGIARGVVDSIPTLIEKSPVDTGLYAQSWDFSVTEKSVILGNTAPHAPIIEKGARPFTPPLKPLLAWAKRVLRDSSQPPNYSSAVWGLARYTQAKIAKEGMKPRHILEESLPLIIANIKKELERSG
jgi:hypothetical protein